MAETRVAVLPCPNCGGQAACWCDMPKGSGSEPPANPREKWPPCPVDTPRCKHGRKPPVSGPSCPECAAERAGSPPVGPLQALRERLDYYSHEETCALRRDRKDRSSFGFDFPEEPCDCGLEAILVSVEEQLAALTQKLTVLGPEGLHNNNDDRGPCGHHPCHQYDLRPYGGVNGCVSCERDEARSQLAALQRERDEWERLARALSGVESPSSPKGDA